MAVMRIASKKLSVVVIIAAILFTGFGYFLGNATNGNKNQDLGRLTEPFFGVHQSGIESKQQAHVSLLAFDINRNTDLAAINRLMRLWTNDAAAATQGREVIGDPNPGMEKYPARITATFGFGYSLFEKLNILGNWPIPQTNLPKFKGDKLESRWSDGDLVVQIAGDDPISIFHLAHLLKRDAKPFASIRYQQNGFLNAAGVNEGEIGRNLLGQIDGTASPLPGSEDFNKVTWMADEKNSDGTIMVIRRIRFALEEWDRLSLNKKTLSTGRSIETGDTVTAENSHVGLSKSAETQKLVRRGFNYDGGYLENGTRDAGLIFISFQNNLSNFIGIQNMLSKMDSLNIWTSHIGSSLFVIPRGVSEQKGDWIGKELLVKR